MQRFRVLLFDDIHEEGKAILRQSAEIVLAERLDEAYLMKRVQDIDAIIVRGNTRVNRTLMERAPKLKVVGRHGVGVENIDLQVATEKGIWVVNTPEANNVSVAEHFFGLALMLSKLLKKSDMTLREGRWPGRHECIGRELHGKILGILGFGRVGKAVGKIGHKGFEMKILYYDTVRYEEMEKDLNAEKVSLDQVLSLSDFISINLPENPETRSLIKERELRLMKPTALILNMARGSLWDEKALYQILKEERIAGAASDVFEVEPVTEKHPLLQLDNFIGTPHTGARTEEALKRMSQVAFDILRVLEGKEPAYPVNRPRK
jgi:D-3-phosphoglycerate dehydrogenase / 2-oxoglutarate reductase